MKISFEMLEGPTPLQVPLLRVRSQDWIRRLIEELFQVTEVRTIALIDEVKHVIAVYDGSWSDR